MNRAFLLGSLGLLGAALWVYGPRARAVDEPAGESVSPFDALGLGDLVTTAGGMAMSQAGLDALKRREGFSGVRYRDAGGWSIGFGHFIRLGETFVEPLTPTEGERLLLGDVSDAQAAVNASVQVPLTQNQFDALVSFAYNVGAGAFRSSTLLKRLNASDYGGARAEFARWNRSQGVVLQSLVDRRADEAEQFA